MEQILNLTPHEITLVNAEGEVVTRISPSGGLVRLAARTVSAGTLAGIPVSRTEYGEPEGLPEEKPGVFLIVSQLVKSALTHRTDLLVPAEMVRDSAGKILGCKSLGL
jgi:hypothetical protein